MSTANLLDPSTFDLDGWIDGVVRPEVTVVLYPREVEFQRRLAELSAEAEAVAPAGTDRGMDEATAETILAQITELRAERDRTALRVQVRQLTNAEVADVVQAAIAAEAPESERSWWVLAAACVQPTFTVDQLRRLHSRDVSGEQMVAQLVVAFNGLRGGLPVPS